MVDLRKLQELFDKYPRHATRKLPEIPELYNYVFLQEGKSLAEKAYNALHPNAHEIYQTCKSCKGQLGIFRSFSQGYQQFCNALCAANSQELKLAKATTNLKKYGSANPWQSRQAKNNYKASMIAKYGVEHAFQAAEVKDKVKTTVKLRYGVEHAFQAAEVKDKAKQNKIEQYSSAAWLARLKIIEEEQGSVLLTAQEYEPGKEFNWKHSCGYEYSSTVLSGRIRTCSECKVKFTSKGEDELAGFIAEHHTIFRNDRSHGFELDIYCPDIKLAIEFNGLYWHSDAWKKADYHLRKTEACEKLGIKLLHIFEDEWDHKREIVKSRLLSSLNKLKRIGARNCEIKEVGAADASKFLFDNHIQGKLGSSVKLGLYHLNTLVALMTFGKPRFNKHYDWELLRYCSLLNTSVVGGASKLLNAFEQTYSGSIISYADKRWSTGNLYDSLGFKKRKSSPPASSYVINGARINRVSLQKHKLAHILGDKYDMKLTADYNLTNAGYHKIYDCGNLVYVKDR